MFYRAGSFMAVLHPHGNIYILMHRYSAASQNSKKSNSIHMTEKIDYISEKGPAPSQMKTKCNVIVSSKVHF